MSKIQKDTARSTNSPFRGLGGWNIDCLIAALAGFYIIHMFARYSGIGISPDSIMYASTAQNIHDHFSLITFNNLPLTFFPVFYPTFLSICIFISGGVDPVSAGPVINGLLFGAVIYLTGYITTKFKAPSLVYKWLILIAVVLSPALQEIYMYLWSETLFILVILIFVIAYHKYLQTHSTKALIIVSVVAAIGCITRYAGVTLVAAGGLLILIDGRLKPKQKFIHLLTFGAIGISLVVGNFILNKLSTGLSTGTREPSITPFKENLYYFGTVILDWAGLPASFDPIAVAFAVIVILGLATLFIVRVAQHHLNSYENIIICYTLTYGLFILVIATISRFERMNSRLLSPMFVPLLLSFTCWIPDLIKYIKFRKKWLLATPFVIAMLAYEYTIARIDYQTYDDFCEYGIPGYTDDDWNKSDFIVFLKQHKHIFKPGYPIYSDADEAVYMFTGMHSTLMPHKFFKKDVEKLYQQKKFYLIDFKKMESPELVGLKELQEHKKLTRLYDFKDGAVYLCESE
ncbi:glycosyltransferase family 39 protein [Mucilaginibacter mali]|uniref:Glycosyltransferase family 39 protein n=1 Tax=Mucilaginibacter mali TaxID=2740462 RepID=A0A7D4Q6Z1_9SPHI|nr:glycosyltransferase family 39 protein [Mucilaginibacter mali]QKJ29651.1 glycosyltransferase family 39 protein [Mucilaginibacter mali]